MHTIPKQIGPYIFLNLIGQGAYGYVYHAIHTTSQIDVSIKVVHKNFNKDHRTRFTREACLLRKMNHPLISKFYQLLEDSNNYYIVLEYLPNGNLKTYMKNLNGNPLDENSARRYFIQIISALEYLHQEMHIIHRDLKAENIVLDRNNNIRLIDFGLSCEFSNNNFKHACGSLGYIAPEMIKEQRYNVSVDIWSAGVLLYALTVGHLPFYDNDSQCTLQKIVYSDPIIPDKLSLPLSDLLKKMLTKDPQKRITLNGIKEHHWYSPSEHMKVSLFVMEQRRNDDKIDPSIIKKMNNLGINTSDIKLGLFGSGSSDSLVSYMILKNEKTTDELMTAISRKTRNSLSLGKFPDVQNDEIEIEN
ncbi:CAMK family protein kinase [Histomonas meleagridis]|uniref:CAMK family protein kinase n=1 Tax=Histomonas meleagridis TaxID=135588 RepID=UPI0035597FA3|nr:CAMK family protein kinase [Histomonas meleagridis]KAH0796777.1 CAMK family protein kinase [Histomonas meleagridis]